MNSYDDLMFLVLGRPHDQFKDKGIHLINDLEVSKMTGDPRKPILIVLADLDPDRENLITEWSYYARQYGVDTDFFYSLTWAGTYIIRPDDVRHTNRWWVVPRPYDDEMFISQARDWKGPAVLWEFDLKFHNQVNRDHLRLELYDGG